MSMKNPQSTLPPGFRFHPTDEELILHYLRKRIASLPLPVSIIAEVDIYKFNPWDLPAKAEFGEKEWYFFSPRDRKYPNGARPNRAAASGYWKATGTDKVIVASASSKYGNKQENLGVKKALVFYKGRPPKGVKTNWIMHEYRMAESPSAYSTATKPMKFRDSSMRLDDWVLCRIYKKSNVLSPASALASSSEQDVQEEESFIQDTSPPQTLNFNDNPLTQGAIMPQKSSSFSNLFDAVDYSMLSSLLADNNNQVSSNYFGFESINPSLNDHMSLNQFEFDAGTGLPEKLPELSSPNPSGENRLKRQHSNTVEADLCYNPSKKLLTSCSFTNNNNQFDMIPNQCSLFNSTFLNQQLLLSSNVQFQG